MSYAMSEALRHLACVSAFLLAAPLALAVDAAEGEHAPQADRLYFVNSAPIEVVEGDDGDGDAVVSWELDGTPQREISFYVNTAAAGTLGYGEWADAGIDYEPIARTLVVVPATQRSGTIVVKVRGDIDVEPKQRLHVYFSDITGAEVPGGTNHVHSVVYILNDDVAPVAPKVFAREDDLIATLADDGKVEAALEVLKNDTTVDGWGSTITILEQPSHGTASVYGQGQYPSSMSISYYGEDGRLGVDRLRYRYCSPAGDCAEAAVDIEILPYAPLGAGDMRAGGGRVQWHAHVAMPSARFVASPLVAPVSRWMRTGTDPTPGSPWDGEQGRHFALVPLPPLAGDHADWRLRAELDRGAFFNAFDPYLDLYLGIDRNGDGRPSADEVLCVGAGDGGGCEVPFRQTAGTDAYWVMMHSRFTDVVQRLAHTFEVPVTAGDGSLVATGPGHVDDDGIFDMTYSWDDDSVAGRASRLGVVRVYADDGQVVGDVPVHFSSHEASLTPTMLLPDAPRTFALASGELLRTIFFDVPAGASRVRIAASSDDRVEYWLWKLDAPPIGWDATHPTPGQAPESPSGAVVSSDAGDDAELILDGAALEPGRWFLVVRNASGSFSEATVGLTLEGSAPVVRPGSYFDAERPGSGIFLYPAGGDWAGLWYTYRPDGHSTWYYLQGAAPGANGLWVGGIYRAAWDGDSRTLTQVGTASVAPTADDAFQFSYTIDGETGSRPHAALGRGCPASEGGPVDISTHWFDPAHDGTGYSVQVWENYEYFAAFVYDDKGRPTFLAAERDSFGGADATSVVQVMKGTCPTCANPSGLGPVRYDVGMLRRTLQGGSLAAIELDAIWNVNFRGESIWSSVDQVQTLGGPGTTQGCEP